MYEKILDALIAMDARISRLEEQQSGSNDYVEALLRRPGHQPGDPPALDVVRTRALDNNGIFQRLSHLRPAFLRMLFNVPVASSFEP